ncbi:MAG: sugar transferase [Verrucomicrobiales bacterium]|nr:sugar transferase [Verrucomicrobiales bacterium]
MPIIALAGTSIGVLAGSPVLVEDIIEAGGGTFARRLRFRTTGQGLAAFRALGRFLRHFRVDELPALWSVVKGDLPLMDVWNDLFPES